MAQPNYFEYIDTNKPKMLDIKPELILDKFERLIYDIVFCNKFKLELELSKYVNDILSYEDFLTKTKEVLKKIGLMVFDEEVKIAKKDIIWTFAVKKI